VKYFEKSNNENDTSGRKRKRFLFIWLLSLSRIREKKSKLNFLHRRGRKGKGYDSLFPKGTKRKKPGFPIFFREENGHLLGNNEKKTSRIGKV